MRCVCGGRGVWIGVVKRWRGFGGEDGRKWGIAGLAQLVRARPS